MFVQAERHPSGALEIVTLRRGLVLPTSQGLREGTRDDRHSRGFTSFKARGWRSSLVSQQQSPCFFNVQLFFLRPYSPRLVLRRHTRDQTAVVRISPCHHLQPSPATRLSPISWIIHRAASPAASTSAKVGICMAVKNKGHL